MPVLDIRSVIATTIIYMAVDRIEIEDAFVPASSRLDSPAHIMITLGGESMLFRFAVIETTSEALRSRMFSTLHAGLLD